MKLITSPKAIWRTRGYTFLGCVSAILGACIAVIVISAALSLFGILIELSAVLVWVVLFILVTAGILKMLGM